MRRTSLASLGVSLACASTPVETSVRPVCRLVKACCMASQRGAARAPPPPDRLTAFYKLADKMVMACQLCRFARSVELSSQAAAQAEALFGGDSLLVASMRYCESASLGSLCQAASGAEAQALLRRSWAVLVSLISLLLRRLEANTLLPGTIREEELDYEAHSQAAMFKAANKPLPPPSALRTLASALGYNVAMHALYRSLDYLGQPFLPQHERKMVASFVLQGLDVIPRTAGMPANLIPCEGYLVAMIEKHIHSNLLRRRSRQVALASGEQRAPSARCAADRNRHVRAEQGRVHSPAARRDR